MNHIEYSLLFFTIFTQASVGIALVIWCLDNFAGRHNLKLLALANFFCISLGMFVSLLHLGVPFEAYRATSHWYSSWLSREVLIFGLYFGLVIIYTFLWWRQDLERFRIMRFFRYFIGKFNHKLTKQLIGLIVIVTGITGIYFSANVYRIPTRPTWNNYWVVITFLAAAVNIGVASGLRYYRKIALAYVVFGLFRLAVGVLQHNAYQSQFERLSVFMRLPSSLWVFLSVTGIILSSVTPVVIGIYFFRYNREPRDGKTLITVLVICVLLGEILNRAVFYMAGVHLPIG